MFLKGEGGGRVFKRDYVIRMVLADLSSDLEKQRDTE